MRVTGGSAVKEQHRMTLAAIAASTLVGWLATAKLPILSNNNSRVFVTQK